MLSAEHKRPLYAFVVVAILCGLVLGHTMRTDAFPLLLGRMAPMIAAHTDLIPGAETPDAGHVAVLAVGGSVSLGDGTTGSDEAVLTEQRSDSVVRDGGRSGEGAGPGRATGHSGSAADGSRDDRSNKPARHATATPPGRFTGHTKGVARGLALGHHKQHQRAVPQAPAARAGDAHRVQPRVQSRVQPRVQPRGHAWGHGKARGLGQAKARSHGKARGHSKARGHGKARGKARGHRR